MKKIDFRKEFKHLYGPSIKEVVFIDIPKMNFLMIDGVGDPNVCKDYREAIEVLYALSYALKFMIKKGELLIDYGVMPLESLWWNDDPNRFNLDKKNNWKWTAMIMQPEFVTEGLFKKAFEQVEKKKNIAALLKVRFEKFYEGLSAQIMHVGPYSEEGPTIKKIHNFVQEKGYKLSGKHHEIYLSDPRKTKPERLKTILRQPLGMV